MCKPSRRLRRAALLLFPKHVLNEQTLDGIVAEGFTDVGAGVVVTPLMKEQGFSFEQSRRLAEMCGERDLGFIAFTGYMKYQYKLLADEPQRLMLLGGHGKVEDLDGLPVRWLCPFRPENKQRYLSLLRQICAWPATVEIHLNDEASLGFRGGQIGCYCDYCQAQFAGRTGQPPPTAPDWNDDLWYEWLETRFRNWVGMHAEFRAAIKQERPDIQVGIQHSPYIPERIYNAWESGVCLAREAAAQDLIATDPYHYNHADGILYRPHRRILSETTRSLVGACINRQVDIYPQGFMPPRQAVPMGRQDGLLAAVVPFALGADLVMPYTYELMRIIPGYFEAFQEARRLIPEFERHAPYAFATMLMPQQSEISGHHETNWAATELRDVADLLYRTGLPWAWFWDQRLDDAGQRLHGPLILPEVHCLTEQQLEHIRAVGRRGQGLLWLGNGPREPWSGHGACPLPARVDHGVFAVEPCGNHPLTAGLQEPVFLATRVDWDGPDGEVVGTIDGRPALVVVEPDDRPEIWLAGRPLLDYYGTIPGGAVIEPTANVELFRRLLCRIAPAPPVARLDPFPPVDDYRTLRPRDRRAVPPIELLPMLAEDSLLALVFPYTPVGTQTALLVNPPAGRTVGNAVELWSGEDWTERMVRSPDGQARLPLNIPGDCDLLALRIELEPR